MANKYYIWLNQTDTFSQIYQRETKSVTLPTEELNGETWRAKTNYL